MTRKAATHKPFPKSVTLRHWSDLITSGMTLKKWCWNNKVLRDQLILSVQKHFPQEWEDHKGKLGPIDERDCEFCGLRFYQNNKRQKFCKDGCSKQHWLAQDPKRDQANRDKVSKWKKDQKARQLASKDAAQDSEG